MRLSSHFLRSPRFWTFRFLGILLLMSAMAATAQTVENGRFRLRLLGGGALEVFDKAAGTTWRQPEAQVSVSDAAAEGRALTYRLNETIKVRVGLKDEAITVALSASADTSVEGLEYPAGFTIAAPVREQTLLLPNCAGFAIPFSAKDRPDLQRVPGYYETCVDQMGLTMPWIAATDGQAGALMLIETPYDSRMRVWTEVDGYRYGVAWRDTKGRFGYERRVCYYFQPKGGAVALCKTYRRHAQAEGLVVTLREKQAKAPGLGRLLGAISLWVVDWPDIELFKSMKEAGLERVLASFHATEKIPPGTVNRFGHNSVYEPMTRDFTGKLQAFGYLAGRYDYYRTIYPPRDADFGLGGGLWIMRRIGYPEQLAWDETGAIRHGYQGGNRPADGLVRGQRCSKCQYELAQAYIPVDVDRAGYDARLLDAVCAVSWQECYNPAHPVTREEDMQWRRKQLQIAVDNGQITGTEHIAHWAVPYVCYAEAVTTFMRFASYRESFNARPFTTPETYRTVVLDERLRFPLWALVFHDCVVLTNRWTFAANRYADESLWDREDLFNLLHGQMPTFMLNRENFAARSARFVRTAQTVGRWNGEIGIEEMIDFRWLTTDASVQQAVYASGRSVVVNFGGEPFELPDGQRVSPAGFLWRPKS